MVRRTNTSAGRRTTTIALATLSALALASCAGGADGDKAEADSGSPVSIDYWHRLPSVEGAKTVDDLVAEWNAANPDIKVTATALQGSAGDSYPKIAAAVEGDNAPCLAQVGVDRVPDLLSTGQLLDVSEYAEQYQDNYLPYAWNKSTFAGQTYGLPQDTGPIVMYYRTDLFEQYGIEVPTTWEEYRAAGEAVKAANPEARIGSFLPDESMWLMALASANGATWWGVGDDGWTVDVDSAETQEVAAYWQGLIDDDIVATTPRWDPTFDQSLNDGTLVATIGASWEAPLIAGAAPDSAGSWGVAQIPMADPAEPMVGEDGGSIVAVLKGCKNPEQAMKFADWLNTNVEGLMPLGLFPATTTPAEGFATPETLKTFFGGQDIYAEFSAANEAVNLDWTFSPTTGQTLTAIQDGTGKMLTGGPGLPEIMSAADASSIASLEKAGITVVK